MDGSFNYENLLAFPHRRKNISCYVYFIVKYGTVLRYTERRAAFA